MTALVNYKTYNCFTNLLLCWVEAKRSHDEWYFGDRDVRGHFSLAHRIDALTKTE